MSYNTKIVNHQNKYMEFPLDFRSDATELNILILQSNRLMGELIAQARGDEKLSDFLIKCSEINTKTLEFIDMVKTNVQEFANDSKVAYEGARVRNILKDQYETILVLQNFRDNYIDETARTQRTT